MKEVKCGLFLWKEFVVSLCIFVLVCLTGINCFGQGQGIVLKRTNSDGALPKTIAGDLEGVLGKSKVRIKFYPPANGNLFFLGIEMNSYELEAFKAGPAQKLQLVFYQSYPGNEEGIKHQFTLDGIIGKDGSYSGAFQEVPGNTEGKFSLQPSQADTISGNYFPSFGGYLFVQLSDERHMNFLIGNDWCFVSGAAVVTGKKAHYEKLMKGLIINFDFDFSNSGFCKVETNANSPEAQEQRIGLNMGNYKCVPDFTGIYRAMSVAQINQEAREEEASRTTAPTPTAEPIDSENNVYCEGMTPEQKSKRLDMAVGVTIVAKEGDDVVFVYTQNPGPADHGATGGHCGVRLDTYRKNNIGVLEHIGRWEDLYAGFVDGDGMEVCSQYLFIKVSTFEDELTGKTMRYVFDGSAQVIGQDVCESSDVIAWVKRDGKYFLWDITFKRIALKTAELKDVWKYEDEINSLASYFSPKLQYANRQLGKDGKTTAIYNLDGTCVKKYDIPFPKDKFREGDILGITDIPNIIFQFHYDIYSIDEDGIPKLKAVLPEYPNRRIYWGVGTVAPGNPYRIFKYEATTDKIKDYPRPMVKLNIVTMEARETLDGGKTWKSIVLKSKRSSVGK